MTTVAQLTIEMAANVARIKTDMEKARSTVDGAMSKISKSAAIATKALGAIGAALSVGALVNLTRSLGQVGNEIQNLSRLAGVGTTTFQQLAFGANNFGIGQEKLADVLKDTQDKIGDFLATGAGGMADFFENIAPRVGVTAENFRQLNGADALQLYISSLEKANLSQNEMTFYMEAIASDSSALIPLFAKNGEALKKFSDEANKLGIVLDKEAIAKTKQLDLEMKKFDETTDSLSRSILQSLIPALTSVASAAQDIIINLPKLVKEFKPFLQGGAIVAGLYALPPAINAIALAVSSRLIPSLVLLAPYVAVFSALALAAGATIKVMSQQSDALKNADTTARRVAQLQNQIAKAQLLIDSGQGSSVTIERLKTMKAQLAEAEQVLKSFQEQAKKGIVAEEESKKQTEIIASIKDREKAEKDAEKASKELQKIREKALSQAVDVLNAEADVTDEIKRQTKDLIDQARAVGMSESQLRQLELAKIDDQIATIDQRIAMISFGDANDDLIKQYKNQIDALKDLKQAKTGLYNKQAAQKIVDANKEVAKQIEEDLVDAFENAFLRGGDFASSLKRAIEAQFAKLVLRPVIQSVVGSGQAAISAAGGIGNLLGSAGNISSLFSAVSGGLVSGVGSAIASAGSMFGSAALGSFAAGVKGSTLAAGLAGPTTAGAGGALGLGSVFGAALPWLGGGLALAGLLGGTRLFGRGKVSASILDQGFLEEQQASLQERFMSTVGALGGTAANASFFFGGNTGRQGQNPNFHLGLDLNGQRRFTTLESREGATGENGTFLGSEIALNQENLSLFTTRAVVTALQQSNFARNINELFDSINERTASMEELTQLFFDVESLKNFNDAMRQMNGPLRVLADSSLAANQSFLQAVGGLEGFQQRMAFFYKEFTSDAEQFSDMSSMLSSELRAVGAGLFSTREQFSAFFKTLGPDQFARISALLPQIDSYYDTIEQRQAESYKATLDSLERIRKAGLGIADYLRQLGITEETLSPQQRLQAASAEFNRLLSLSKLGDVTSLEKITGASDQLLDAARSFFGSNAEFKSIFDRVTNELNGLTQGQSGNVFTAQPIAFQRQDQTNQALVTEIQGLRSDIASGDSINIKVVTVDGKVIMEETLSAARERSRRGELVVYAAGVK